MLVMVQFSRWLNLQVDWEWVAALHTPCGELCSLLCADQWPGGRSGHGHGSLVWSHGCERDQEKTHQSISWESWPAHSCPWRRCNLSCEIRWVSFVLLPSWLFCSWNSRRWNHVFVDTNIYRKCSSVKGSSKARLVGSGCENLRFYFAVIVVLHSKMNLCASLSSCESCWPCPCPCFPAVTQRTAWCRWAPATCAPGPGLSSSGTSWRWGRWWWSTTTLMSPRRGDSGTMLRSCRKGKQNSPGSSMQRYCLGKLLTGTELNSSARLQLWGLRDSAGKEWHHSSAGGTGKVACPFWVINHSILQFWLTSTEELATSRNAAPWIHLMLKGCRAHVHHEANYCSCVNYPWWLHNNCCVMFCGDRMM